MLKEDKRNRRLTLVQMPPMMMKEGLPNLAHSRLEDVIRQAGSLNILRSVSVESIMVARFLVV